MKISRRQFGLTALMSISLPPLKAIATQINVPSPAVSDIGHRWRWNIDLSRNCFQWRKRNAHERSEPKLPTGYLHTVKYRAFQKSKLLLPKTSQIVSLSQSLGPPRVSCA